MDKNMWCMMNVVWYDGTDAYVSKFILQAEKVFTEAEGNHVEPTKESRRRVMKYLEGNGELLKIDPLYSVDFDNIVALKEYEKSTVQSEQDLFAAYDRFKNMWF